MGGWERKPGGDERMGEGEGEGVVARGWRKGRGGLVYVGFGAPFPRGETNRPRDIRPPRQKRCALADVSASGLAAFSFRY